MITITMPIATAAVIGALTVLVLIGLIVWVLLLSRARKAEAAKAASDRTALCEECEERLKAMAEDCESRLIGLRSECVELRLLIASRRFPSSPAIRRRSSTPPKSCMT